MGFSSLIDLSSSNTTTTITPNSKRIKKKSIPHIFFIFYFLFLFLDNAIKILLGAIEFGIGG